MNPTSELADMARRGLHDLRPYWTPDHGYVDPLDDPGVRAEVRRYIGGRWRRLQAERQRITAAMGYCEADDPAYRSDAPV